MDYQFKDIEQKWQKFWADNGTFKAENNSAKPKYYVMDMFPYPSGAGLHVGHPLGYIASDIFARYKRLKGFNVLHPMGYDSFGLPAEQYAIQTGQHPAITTETNIATYRRQLDQIGFSFDWSREVRTSSPDFYKWTQWIFMQLFNSWYNKDADKAESIEKLVARFEKYGSAGINAVCDEEVASFTADEWKAYNNKQQQEELLKYRLTYLRESTVNWCPALGTVLANDEVKDGFSERGGYPVEQKKMMQWSMRITAYAERLLQGLDTIDWPEPLKEMQRNWIGKSIGASVRFSLTPALSKGEGAKGEGVKIEGYETADPTMWEILKANSQSNRQNPTEAENVLWQLLRNNQTGFKIRRQHAIDGFIADFVCLGKGMVIEVDGGYHNDELTKELDEFRTEVLNSKGFDVIRFTNDEVLRSPQQVIQNIKEKLTNQPDRKVLSFGEDLGEAQPDRKVLSFGEDLGEAKYIEVFTTRVDTIFGVTSLVLAPEHELVAELTTPEHRADVEAYIEQTKKKSELDRMADAKTVSGAFTGSYVLNPLNNEKVPIWIADYVLAGYGTGAVMGVPSGDQRDYLFAKHFNLPITPIIDIQNIETEADPTKDGKYINSDFINGLNYKEATAAVIAKLEAIGAGKAKVNFRMRDAIFGRQRYWGEPVPVYFNDGLPYLISESDLPLLLPEVDKYLPTESGEPPLGRAEGWVYKASPKSSPKERTFENSAADSTLSSEDGRVASPKSSPKERTFEDAADSTLSSEDGRVASPKSSPKERTFEDAADSTLSSEDGRVASPKSSPKERTFENQTDESAPAADSTLSFGEGRGEAEYAYQYELSTMPGWAGSSWYWYRYMDAHNNKEFASKEAIAYWKDVDLYIGGSEHATGHLLYSRFWNKFLKDMDLVIEEEPFKKLINQGMITGESAFVNSIGVNIIAPKVGPSNLGSLTDEENKKFIALRDKYAIIHDLYLSDEIIKSLRNLSDENRFHIIEDVTSSVSKEIRDLGLEGKVIVGLLSIHFYRTRIDISFVGSKNEVDTEALKDADKRFANAEFRGSKEAMFFSSREIEKMSKSKFNVVNPDDIISRYGADTLRMYEMFLGPLEQSKPWNTNGIEGVFKFLRKFWRLFHNDAWEFNVSDAEPTKAELKSLHKIIRKVEEDVERFSFNTSVSSFMIAVNELTDLKCNNRAVLQDLVVVLSSYAPHICEELWVMLGNKAGTLSYAPYPKFNPAYLVEDEFSYPISINGKMKMNLNISLSLEAADIEAFVLANADVQKYLDGKSPKKVIVVKGRIVNMVV